MSTTVADQLRARAGDDGPGLLFEDRSWTWREVVRESARYGAALADLLDADRPQHVGVLLDNVPEFLFALGGAALGGQVLVGLNATRSPVDLAGDLDRTDVQVVLTDADHRGTLPDDVAAIEIGSAEWHDRLAGYAGDVPEHAAAPDDLLMLIFTSGTSGNPKAVRITHAKVAAPGEMLGRRFGLGPDDVAYLSMPLFHSNAIMAGWAPALATEATVALARRFSASGFLPDVRRFGATYANYVGKPLAYVLATPERPDDADNPLRLAFGNEANERDIAEFARRFGCTVVDSYSSTENAVIVRREPGMPAGALGRPETGVAVYDPETMRETPDAVFDADGRLLNGEEAIGEIVNTTGTGAFAGYYGDAGAEQERMRGGMYWSGDLAYRDADGWLYFAGRTAEWLRVDGENLTAAPIERVLLRHPAIAEAAVYAVPDPITGDQVAAAVTLRGELTPAGLQEFLAEQPDLSAKAWPRYVRILETLPRTATNKVLKRSLAAEGIAGDVALAGVLWEREERGRAFGVATPV